MPRTWQTIRVFVSSPFRDMQAERDHLVRVVFPAVRERLEPHRVHLIDIDLRWGVTREQAENDQALGLCLEQIDECRPFFLGLLGERLGWVPRHVPPRLLRQHPWLAEDNARSITELEFRHGALDHLPQQTHALFCLRDPAATLSVPEPHRTATFLEPRPDAVDRRAALKDRIRTSGHPVINGYPCAWDAERQRLAGLEEFGNAVADWLLRAVRTELRLPDRPADAEGPDAWLADEADHHERFLESRLRVFVGRRGVQRELMAFVRGDDVVPCAVIGEAGVGKTAVLARLADAVRRDAPEAVVLPHFAGAGPRSTALRDLLRRLVSELARRFKLGGEPAEHPDRLVEQFRELVWRLPAATRVVLLLDGLDQLDPTDQAHELYWLPGRLPPHVKLVVSCSAEGPVRKALDRVGARLLDMGPLADRERLALLHRLPSLSAKTLDERQVRSLLDNPATRNPLFLTAALEELRGFGSFEDLDHRIASIPSGGSALAELFDQVLARLEADFGAGLVARVLTLLAAARRGLSSAELDRLTDDRGQGYLFALLRQLRPWLIQRGGLIDLGPEGLHAAVHRRYFLTETERRRAHEFLADHFATRLTDTRRVDELPWHLTRTEQWARLRDLLADLEFFDAAWQASAFEVKGHWARLESVGLRLADAYRDVVACPGEHPPERLARLAMLLADTGHVAEAMPIRCHLLEHARGGDPVKLAAAMSNLALLHKARGEIDDALRLYTEAEALCRQNNDRHGLQRTLGNRARLLRGLGDLDGAMAAVREQEAICREAGNRQGLQAALGSQAQVLQARGDTAGALRLLEERERICRETGNRHGLQIALNGLALLLQQAGDLDGALRRLEESEAVCRDLGNRQGLQVALGQRASVLRSRGDPAGAAELLGEQERICREIGNALGLQIALGNRAQLCRASGEWQTALELLAEAERLARELRNPEAIAVTLRHRAEVLADLGRVSDACTAADEAYRVAETHGLAPLAAWIDEVRTRLAGQCSVALCDD